MGELKDGQYHGHGKLTKKNGDIWVGLWAENEMNGEGSCELANGDHW